ncbi:MAG: hypothetical protein HYY64_11980 [Candidatus Rokubacteria bacterium]|nr:hypothetical protein [Candidatus Rokubacteria bacterium]
MRRQQEVLGVFDIAGIACGVECREEAFWNLLSPRYAEFASDDIPRLRLRVEVTAPPSDDVAARWSGPFARIAGGDGVLSIEGAGFRGEFDERSGQGRIAQPLDPSPFETFLTAIYAGRLLRAGGFFLHAAALVDGDRAHVFFGPSESGKTTVAELVREGVISDEIVAIRREGDQYRVSGVPWRGRRLTAPLAGLFRLRKARETSFTPLAPVKAVRQLLPSVFFSRADAAEIARFLEVGGELVTRVPCYEMRFAPDRSFWHALPRSGQGEKHALSV